MSGKIRVHPGLSSSLSQKSTQIRTRRLILATAAMGMAFIGRQASAANLTWDGGDATHNGTFGGAGTWNLNSTLNWDTGSAEQTWTDNSTFGADTAIFTGTAGAVTLNTNLSAYGLQFLTTGYTIAPTTSGTLTLGGGGIDASTLTSGTTAISNAISLQAGESWKAGTGATVTASGTITRNVGSTVDFSTTGTFNGAGLLTAVGTTVQGWATVGGSDWAVSNGTNILGFVANGGTYTTSAAAGTTAASYTGNVDVTANSGQIVGLVTANSLRFNTAGAETLTFATGANVLSSGGILVTSTVGNNLSTITNGTLEGASGKDLVVIQNNINNGLTIASIIANNGASATGLTKSGPGLLTVSNGSNSFTGNVTINGGTLSATGQGSLGAATHVITINPGAILAVNTNNVWSSGTPGATTPTLIINGGTLNANRYNVSGNSANSNGLTLQNGGTLNFNNILDGAQFSAWQFGSLVTVAGTSGSSIINGSAGANVLSHGDLYSAANGSTTFNVASTGDPSGIDLTVSGILGDQAITVAAGVLIKSGAGTMSLSAANTYTGVTTVGAGTLALNFTTNSNVIKSGNSVSLTGGQLRFDNLGTAKTQTFGTTVLTSGTSQVTLGSGYTSGVLVDLGTLSGGGLLNVSNLSNSATWIKASGNVSQSILLNGAVTANNGQSLVATDASGDLLTVATTDYLNNAIIPTSVGVNIRTISTGSSPNGTTSTGFVGLGTAGTTNWNSLTNAYTTGTTTIDITNNGANASNILRFGAVGAVDSAAGGNLVLGVSVASGGTLTAGGAANTAGTLGFTAGTGNTITVNSVIADNVSGGVVSLTQAGGGTLILNAANTFSGATTGGAGPLTLGNSLALQNSTVAPGTGGIAFSSSVSSHAFTFGDISGGNNLALQDNAATPNPVALTVGGNNATGLTYSGVISGTGGLTKVGSGTLTLSTNETYTGPTVVNAGTLNVNGTNNGVNAGIGHSSSLTINNNATVTAGGADNGLGATGLPFININAGGILNSGSTFTNNILGIMTLAGGTLAGFSPVTGDAGIYGTWNFEGTVNAGGVTATSTISALGNALNRPGGAIFNVSSGATNGIDLDFTGTIVHTTSGGDQGLVKAGNGVMRLGGVNTYTSATTIQGGTLMLGPSGSISSTPSITIVPGAVFDVSNVTGGFTLGSTQTLRGGRNSSPATDVNGNVTSSGGTFSPNVANSPNTLTINGNLTLTGGTLNYNLGVGGSATVSDLIALTGASRSLNVSGTVTVQPLSIGGNGTYTLINGFTSTTATASNFTLGAFASTRGTATPLFAVGANSVTLQISGLTPAALNWTGIVGGAWDINSTSNWLNTGTSSPDVFFNGDAVTFANSPTTPAVTLATGVTPSPASVTFTNTATTTYTLSGLGGIAGAGAITVNGGGQVNLLNANTFTGGTTITNSSTLSIGNNGTENAAALGTGPITIGTGTGTANAGTLWLQPGSSSATFSFPNSVTLNGGTIRGEDGVQRFATGPGATFAIGASGGTVQATYSTKDVYIDGIITGSGALAIAHGATNSGQSGAVHITNPNNTYNGTVTAGNGGVTLSLDTPNALPSANVILVAGGSLLLNSAGATTLAGLSGAAGTVLPSTTTGAYTLNINNPSITYNYTGTLTNSSGNTGVLALTKNGAGSFFLNAANTYSGGTIVNAGFLGVGNSGNTGATETVTSLGSGTVTVNTGGTVSLGDIGSVATTFSVANAVTLGGGTITSFDGIQRLTGSLNVTTASILASTFNDGGKGFFIDGLTTGTGNLQIKWSALDNPGGLQTYDGSTIHFTNTGTAAANSYSGTMTVTNIVGAGGGSYLQIDGHTALANATINLSGNNTGGTDVHGAGSLLFGAALGTATIGGLSGAGSFILADQAATPAAVILSVGANNTPQTYSGAMSGAGAFTKVGTSTQTLTGINTYTGPTTITGGTLAMGTGGKIPAASAMVMNGGTFLTNGISQTTSGTLTLSASSVIDFGTGSNILTFGASNGVGWTGSTTLTILDWTGVIAGGGTDQFIVGNSNSGLTPTQLTQITFSGFSPGAQILSNGEVVPASTPEPASIALFALGAVGLLARRRRR